MALMSYCAANSTCVPAAGITHFQAMGMLTNIGVEEPTLVVKVELTWM